MCLDPIGFGKRRLRNPNRLLQLPNADLYMRPEASSFAKRPDQKAPAAAGAFP
jgi:hypothetical protein